jgi:endonuclease/exonuclease/phosphatase family metal-dependent hydrolase
MFGLQEASPVSRLGVRHFDLSTNWLGLARAFTAVGRMPRLVRPTPSRLPRQHHGGTRTVRVVNWNLLHARKDNDRRLAVVARILEHEQPDVVALQEVSQSWLLQRSNRAEVLAQRLGFAWSYRATNGAPKLWEEGLAILARRSIVRTARRRLDGSRPWPLNARQVLIGETHLSDGTPFAVASVHLSFPENGEVENLEQALDATDLIAREVLARGVPTVLVGDLNAPPGALSVRALTTGEILGGEAPFVDAWAAVGSGPGITSTPTNPYTDAPADPPQRIDYVLVLQGTRPLARPIDARVVGDRPAEDGVYGSDHFGLVVDLECASPPARGADEDGFGTAAQDLRARIARVRSKIRTLRNEARAEITRTRRSLASSQTGGYFEKGPTQRLRAMTLAKVRAAFGRTLG